MADGEAAALKDALCNQYVIMKKLYAELEEEREASATAASEALSMILRLQREKAVEKMEACQYKRIAEEKMHYAEECLEILEEVTQQKQLEIASLRFQLQAYHHKLLNSGVTIPDFGEMDSFGSPSFSGSNAPLSITNFKSFRRNVSLPSLQCALLCSGVDTSDQDSPLHPRKRPIWQKIGNLTDHLTEDFDESAMSGLLFEESVNHGDKSDWNQAKEVNKNGSEVAYGSSVDSNELQTPPSVDSLISEEDSRTWSWYSALSGGDASCDLSTGGIGMRLEDAYVLFSPSEAEEREDTLGSHELNSSCSKSKFSENTSCTASVHDVYEVSENKDCNVGDPYKQVLEEPIVENKNAVRMSNMKLEEDMDYFSRDDEWLNKICMNKHYGSKLSTPRKGAFLQQSSRLSTPRKGTVPNYHLALLDSKTEVCSSQTDFEQLRIQLQQLENERIVMQEDSEKGKEQLKLLREIFKQLNTIETHIKNSKSKQSSQQDDSSLVSVMEALLCFSI